jgi:hypothetical protein
MKYNPNQYASGFSICGLLIAGMFLYWGIDAFLHGFWDFGISWLGFVWIGIGLAILGSQIAALANKSKLRNIVSQEFQANPNISVEEISANTGISVRDVRAIILDLKAAGRLRGQFSASTGEAQSIEVIKPEKSPIQEEASKVNYCPNCGTPIERENSVFCAYCGSKL